MSFQPGGYVEFRNPAFITKDIVYGQLPILSPLFKTSAFSNKSLFADNSLVVYKKHSLASGGVGSVINSRKKAKYT